jgi:hypothetical protein
MARWTLNGITLVPRVSDGDSDDPAWYALQHALGIDTFGVNLVVASRADQTLVEEHSSEPAPSRSSQPGTPAISATSRARTSEEYRSPSG